MKKTYSIAGAVVLVVLLGFFWFVNSEKSGTDSSNNILTPVSRFDHSHGMALDATDVSKLFIATHDGLYVLQDDKDLYRIGSSRDDLMGFTAHPTVANSFFSSGHPARGGNIGFQKSTDGGVMWEKISQGLGGPVDFHAMTVSAANPDIVYGSFGGRLQRSADGGRNWEYAKGAVNPISLSTHPTLESIVYAATQSGVQVSEDKGDSWKSLSPQLEGGAVSVLALQPGDPQYALAFSERLNGLGKSADGGVTWQSVAERFEGGAVLHLSFSRSEPSTVYALTNSNTIFKSLDKGDTWTKIR